ncbi:MAG: sigma-70 family RNA polymerase sigma factor [Planctomycetota bacterium]|nr:sigma-70 family RNA polymerase sigma factor [Planctomycetota bacterium]
MITRVELDALRARIEAGESDAWEELLAVWRPRMLSLLDRRGVDPDLAEDVVQEAMVMVWGRWASLRDPSRAWSWVSSIVLNRWRSVLRSARVVEEFPEDVMACRRDPARRLLQDEARSWIASRLATLRPQQSRAVRLRLAESLSPEAAARCMGVTRGRLRRMLYEGVKTVRAASSEEGEVWARTLGVAG